MRGLRFSGMLFLATMRKQFFSDFKTYNFMMRVIEVDVKG